MYSILSLRSKEFYIIFTLILIVLYIWDKEHHKQLHNNLISGVIRGLVTGFILGGAEGMLPAASVLTILNVLSFYLETFAKKHITTI